MKINQLIILVTFQVVYQQYPQNIDQNLQTIQHKNIIYKTYLLLLLFMAEITGRGMIQAIIHSPNVKTGYKYNKRDNYPSPQTNH